MSTDWREMEPLRPLPAEADVVNSMSPEQCRAKAGDCRIRAEAIEHPRQQAAMLRYAEWWDRLAQYRAENSPRSADKTPGSKGGT